MAGLNFLLQHFQFLQVYYGFHVRKFRRRGKDSFPAGWTR